MAQEPPQTGSESPQLAELVVGALEVWDRHQEPREPSYSDDPALVMARICVSEESWGNLHACTVLWQVIKNIRARHCDLTRIPEISECRNDRETMLSAMRRASRYASGVWRAQTPRQAWISTLQPNETPPEGWRECKPGMDRCTGTWMQYVRPWKRLLEHTAKLVANRLPNACEHTVLAWGGIFDREIMQRRNAHRRRAGLPQFIRVDCGDMANDVYALEDQ